jgi:RHS repeat-associated protein
VAGKGTITYTYDAAGNKLRKQTVEGTKTSTTLYAGGIVYENDTLQFISHEEGRLRINNNNYVFDYYLKDHLGNVRMTITDDNTQPTPVIDATSYYPFGLVMSGISTKASRFHSIGSEALANRYKFNGGNELQSGEFIDGSGLEMYDAVHRMYDAQIGRFRQIDKLSELSIDFTPYGFARNNPIRMNDPIGLKEDTVNGKSPEVVVKSSRKEVASNQINQMNYAQITGWIDGQRRKGATVETIQNWALGNPYLSNNTLDKILDGTSNNALAIRKAQDEAWELEGEIYQQFLLLVSGGVIAEVAALIEAKEGILVGKAIIEGRFNDTKSQLISKLLKFVYNKFGRQALKKPATKLLLKERKTYREILTPANGIKVMKKALPEGTHMPPIVPPFF